MWNVIGQEPAVAALSRAIAEERISHAYLFSGPPQVGKSTTALQFARTLNCRGEDPPCGRCRQCHLIEEGKHPDVEVVGIGGLCDESGPLHKDHAADGSKEIRICQVRRIIHLANRAPFEGRYRVLIIDPADSLNDAAANALLKTLEEPPVSLVLILITAREDLLLPTVRSRCRQVPFRALAERDVERALVETWEVPEEDASRLARLSGGRLGWAVSAWEDETVLPARQAVIDDVYRLTTVGRDERFAYARELSMRFSRDRDGVYAVLDLWRGWWRDVLLVAAGAPQAVGDSAAMDTLTLVAGKYNIEQVKSFLEAIERTRQYLLDNINPQLALEVLMIDIPTPASRKEQQPVAPV